MTAKCRLAVLLSSVVGCAPEPITVHPAPTPRVDLAAPWRLAHHDEASLAFRIGEGPDGVRVTLLEGGQAVGVTPIHAGRPLTTRAGGQDVPLVRVPWPGEPLSSVQVEVQGLDLIVRLAGPPLSAVSDHAAAPADPVLTWVRLRPRGDSWRIVLTGLGTVTLPGPEQVAPAGRGFRVRTTSWGSFDVDTDAPATSSAIGDGAWTLSTAPSLGALEPYPRLGITWAPPSIIP